MARTMLVCAVAAAAAALIAIVGRSVELGAMQLATVHAAEASFANAEQLWGAAMLGGGPVELHIALEAFDGVLDAMKEAGLTAAAEGGLLGGMISFFVQWVGRPLRLRCLHRVAAAHELLREQPAAIVAAHQELIDESYCEEVVAEMLEASDETATSGHIRQHFEAW